MQTFFFCTSATVNFLCTNPLKDWTVAGFIRNTFYNGWNQILPWIAYFLFGMWLGRLDWSSNAVKIKVLVISEIVFLSIEALQYFAAQPGVDPDLTFYVTADYMPPTLPFLLSTASFGCAMLVIMLWLGEKNRAN